MSELFYNMKTLSYNSKERLIGILLIPPMAIFINYFIFGSAYFEEWRRFITPTLVTMVVVLIVYILCSMTATILLNRFPKYSQTFKRIGIELLCFVGIMAASITTLFYGYDYISIQGMPVKMENYAWVIIVGATCNLLATSFNEGAAFYEKWREVVDESDQLKRENLQSQLEGLKGQVNPHFLFNSLNSLSSLISDDPEKAEKFLDEMSKVYRYLLRTNEEGLTSLDSEMQFIHSYFHLLKTRYGDGLEMETRISEKYGTYQLPPLTLQMLVENEIGRAHV